MLHELELKTNNLVFSYTFCSSMPMIEQQEYKYPPKNRKTEREKENKTGGKYYDSQCRSPGYTRSGEIQM